MDKTEHDIRATLIEEAELTLTDTLCVVVTLTTVETPEPVILSVTGPFTKALAGIGWGEETCAALIAQDPVGYEQVRYELRALFTPEQ